MSFWAPPLPPVALALSLSWVIHGSWISQLPRSVKWCFTWRGYLGSIISLNYLLRSTRFLLASALVGTFDKINHDQPLSLTMWLNERGLPALVLSHSDVCSVCFELECVLCEDDIKVFCLLVFHWLWRQCCDDWNSYIFVPIRHVKAINRNSWQSQKS